MPRVTVHYVGFLQQLAGITAEEVAMPAAATVRDLIAALCASRGDDLAVALLTRAGRLREGTRIIVGGCSVSELQGLETRLDDAKEVTVVFGIYPIAGGSGI